MNETKVALLNLFPSSPWAERLESILRTSTDANRCLSVKTLPIDGISFSNANPEKLLSDGPQDLIFCVLGSISVPGAVDWFKSLRQNAPGTPLIVVFGSGEPNDIFDLLKLGISDFITPPIEPSEVLPRIWRLCEGPSSRETVGHSFKERLGLKELIGNSHSFVSEVKKIPLVAKFDSTVLIMGETGTGKELYARAIHYLGPRARKPFIPINCGSLSPELAESELFGHERGAFTGAVRAEPGLVHEAEGGTVFLDEVDCLPLRVQTKLLRFLQEKEYRRVGSPKVLKADVRVITATNSKLQELVEQGKFRQDLFYRLNVVNVTLPPLRERVEDIPLLAQHFLKQFVSELGLRSMEFSSEATQALMHHVWPGNVRELQNVIERAVVLSNSPILEPADIELPESSKELELGSFQAAKAKTIEEFEQFYIKRLLMAHHGNISQAARAAGKNRRAFWALIQKHNIDVERYREVS